MHLLENLQNKNYIQSFNLNTETNFKLSFAASIALSWAIFVEMDLDQKNTLWIYWRKLPQDWPNLIVASKLHTLKRYTARSFGKVQYVRASNMFASAISTCNSQYFTPWVCLRARVVIRTSLLLFLQLYRSSALPYWKTLKRFAC